METSIIARNNEIVTAGKVDVTADLLPKFQAYADVKPASLKTYVKNLKPMFIYFHNHDIVRPIRADLLAYREDLKRDHKATTVQNYICAVRIFFTWLELEGLYPNIAAHLKGATVSREHKKDYFSAEQVKAIFAGIDRGNIKGKRDYAMIVLMTTCGLRDIEVSRANVEDLRTVAGAPVLFVQGKGREDKNEYVKLPAGVETAVRAYLSIRRKSGERVKGNSPLFASLSGNSRGHRLTTRSISRVAKTRMQDAGYDSDRLTAHSLRHTAVTLALLAGEDLAEVQKFARHSNISTTMIYNHAIDAAKNTCSAAVAAAVL